MYSSNFQFRIIFMPALLTCLWANQNGHDIKVEQGVTIFLGRNRETGIKSLACSRKQVEVKLDEKGLLCVRKVGTSPTLLDGKPLESNVWFPLKHGDIFQVIEGFPYQYCQDATVPESIANGVTVTSPVESQSDKRDEMDYDEEEAEVAANLRRLQDAAKAHDEMTDSSPATTVLSSNTKSSHKVAEPGWKDFAEIHVYTSAKGVLHRPKIASFDLDGTIICTKSGKVYPTSPEDWRILYPDIPKALRELHEKQDYKIVIFSNQKGLMTGKTNLEAFKQKIESICSKIPAPCQVFLSSKAGFYRKPLPGMWEHLKDFENGDTSISKEESFYVGDAAGREKTPTHKKDHSCSDRLFALNLDLEFFTPEEYFLKKKKGGIPFHLPEFSPKDWTAITNRPLLEPPGAMLAGQKQPEVKD